VCLVEVAMARESFMVVFPGYFNILVLLFGESRRKKVV
jgi:hypothetical protein